MVDFDATNCKGGSALSLEPAVARTQVALETPDAYARLFCWAWQVNDSGTVTIDVINRNGGCGVEWSAYESRVEDNSVDLGIQNAACVVAGCGSCRYDFTFEVAGLSLDKPAEVRIVEAGCDGEPDDVGSAVELPIDREPEGAMCRMLGDGFVPQCSGLRERPCKPEPMVDILFGTCAEGRCDDGLACVDDICFTACEDDDDCPLAIESCQEGACRLREPL